MSDNTSLKMDEPNETKEQSLETQQLIVFRQGTEEYGLHIDQIKEVVLTPNITKMPQTPNYVKGVANIRGNIIGIIDLEEKFGIKEATTTDRANKENNYTLVVESDEFKVGILVTEVPNTLSVSSADMEHSINIVHDHNVNSEYIQAIVKLKDRLIILIDIFKVLNEQELETVTSNTVGAG
ncbi:chemotaxis protein CheW [Fulvivirgaceae bacterium BMA12]|uniref:Chemotaxis protein CheW n=1 Tax=Agaribacillus aureus TaxID=3051825 RepID=A0ABT8L7F8_9BACT|nr:chemotaxis protein CheW [Fulvivirgaceae bacterium BMA12]